MKQADTVSSCLTSPGLERSKDIAVVAARYSACFSIHSLQSTDFLFYIIVQIVQSKVYFLAIRPYQAYTNI